MLRNPLFVVRNIFQDSNFSLFMPRLSFYSTVIKVVAVVPPPAGVSHLGDVHCPETYSKNGLARHVRIAAITTTKRALPVSESNGPLPCPSPDIELSWRLESNQTLCLARQCPHRCVPDSSRALHLFAALVGRTSCLKHLACTFFRNS